MVTLGNVYGPKMSVNTNVLFNGKASSQVEDKILVAGSLAFRGVGKLSYRLAQKVEIYVGGELGSGIVGIQKEEKSKIALISKVSIGTKIVDKYTVGAYFGYGEKGIAGLEKRTCTNKLNTEM